MSEETPLPPSGDYIASLKRSTEEICRKENITIDRSAIEQLIASPAFGQSFERLSNIQGLALPLKFASHVDELNVLSFIALLNFGSAFDAPLREQTGYGSANAIRSLVFAMYITSNTTDGDYLCAQSMATIPSAKIAEFMGVKVHVEKEHPTLPGIVVGELGGPVHQYVELVAKTVNETGKRLETLGYPHLGMLVASLLHDASKEAGQSPEALTALAMEKIVRALPAFQDSAVVDGTPVCLFNKTTFLLNAICARFGQLSPPPFPIPMKSALPAFSDGVTVSLLVHLKIIVVSESSKFSPDLSMNTDTDRDSLLREATKETPSRSEGSLKQGPVVTQAQAAILRAASVVAVDTFSSVANEMQASLGENAMPWLKTVDVSSVKCWLTGIVKDRADYRGLPTILCRETVHF